MPPRAKLTKKEIAEGGLALIRRGEDITARALAEQLGCSPRPLFTVFSSMEEITAEILRAAYDIFASYIREGMSETRKFRGAGRAYIRFAIEEPELFRFLFMTPAGPAVPFEKALPLYEQSYEKIIASISALGIEAALSERLFNHMWVYTHGIAVMAATKVVEFTEQKTDELIDEVFRALALGEKLKNA